MTITVTIDAELYARLKRLEDDWGESREHIVIAGIESQVAELEEFHGVQS